MEEKKKITKKEILQLLPFLCMVIAVIGLLSYAYVTVDLEGLKISGVTKPEVSMSYEEKSNALNLSLTPMNDTTGKTQTNYFEFKIDATGKIDGEIPATIYINETKKTIGNENIKMYLTKVENNTETQVLAPTTVNNLKKYSGETNAYVLNSKTYTFTNTEKKSYSDTYRLRAWLKEGATIESGDATTTTEPDGSITAETASANYQFKVNVSTKNQTTPGTEELITKVGTGGLVADSHPETSQLQATTAYRYTGTNPDNYIKFNNETWRIIGIFDTDNGTGTLEKRIKIIRDSIGNIAWDSNNTSDWSKASLMTLLNSGDYYNRTGAYASTGLTDKAKSQIADAKWYLGGTDSYTDSSNGLASHWYSYERGIAAIESNPTNWVGKVGLMYPSDYGYATSGGSTPSRNDCLQKELSYWDDASYSYCLNNNWLLNRNKIQYTLTVGSSRAAAIFVIHETGYLDDDSNGNGSGTAEENNAIRPTVYLKADVSLTGEGTSSSPYEIE